MPIVVSQLLQMYIKLHLDSSNWEHDTAGHHSSQVMSHNPLSMHY